MWLIPAFTSLTLVTVNFDFLVNVGSLLSPFPFVCITYIKQVNIVCQSSMLEICRIMNITFIIVYNHWGGLDTNDYRSTY